MSAVEQLDDRVYRVEMPFDGGLVNSYLLDTPRRTVIDTGTAVVPEQSLLPALRRLGWRPESVSLILNTHGHPDHGGGNSALRAATAAAVWLHADDCDLGDPGVVVERFADHPYRLLGEVGSAAHVAAAASLRQAIGQGFRVDETLTEHTSFDLGEGVHLAVLHVPGHTSGSCAFLLRDSLLFSGDAVSGCGSHTPSLPLYEDAAAYRASLERLVDLEPTTLALGHRYRWPGGAPTAVRRGADVAATVRASLDAWEAIDAAVAETLLDDPGIGLAPLVRRVVLATARALDNPQRADGGYPFGSVLTVAAHAGALRGTAPAA